MTAEADHVVGIDVGSGGARAVAIDRDGTVVAAASRRYVGVDGWARGHAEPKAWLDAVDAVHTEVTGILRGRRPLAVGVGGQNPTTVDADGETAVTYNHPECSTDSLAGDAAAQVQVLERELGHDTAPFQVWPWIIDELGGCGHLQGVWPGLEPLAGFGEPVAAGTEVALTRSRAGFPSGIPLVLGGEDAYMAFWAAGVDVPGRALDPGGRTGGLGVAAPDGHLPTSMYRLSSAAAGVSIVGGPVTAHGLIVEWWASLVGLPVPDLLELAAGSPPGANGVLALPYLDGERAPRWDADLRAEIVGLGSATTRADVARALLEATAFGLAHIAAELADAGIGLDTLVCAGSPARSRVWCEIKASVLEVPVEVPRHLELAAYGAALAAGAAVGWWPAPGDGASGDWPRPPVDRIEPSPDDAYRRGYARFVELGDESVRRLGRSRRRPTPPG